MAELIFNGPAEFNMEVFVINDETKQKGKAVVGLGVFEYPSKIQVQDRINKFINEEMAEHLPGFRAMTKQEAWDHAISEKTDSKLAMPGGSEWSAI